MNRLVCPLLSLISFINMVSVIISTLTGGASYLVKLLPDLSKEKEIELIVIDNNSRDGTLQILSNYDCVVKINKDVKSFSESNNIGAMLARGEDLLFLNNDTTITPGFIKLMKDSLYRGNDIGAVGCQIRLMDGQQKIQHAGVYFTKEYIPYELGLELPFGIPALPLNDPRAHSLREVPSVTACCMMMKKSTFLNVGMFNESYKNGWEDTDLTLRLRESGYRIFYQGQALIYHKHFGSKDKGRFTHEKENRELYDSIWVNTGRAKAIFEHE